MLAAHATVSKCCILVPEINVWRELHIGEVVRHLASENACYIFRLIHKVLPDQGHVYIIIDFVNGRPRKKATSKWI